MHNRRIRGVVLGTAATLVFAGMTACAPSPGPGLCTHKYLSAEMAVLDTLGNVAARLTINEDICITPVSWIVSNVGTQEQHNVGGYAFFDGAALESHPAGDASGDTGSQRFVTGVGMAPRLFHATWTEDVLAGIAGQGFHVGMGKCYLTGYTEAFGDAISVTAESGYCTEMRTRLWG